MLISTPAETLHQGRAPSPDEAGADPRIGGVLAVDAPSRLWHLPSGERRVAGLGVHRPGAMGQRHPHWARRPGLERRTPGAASRSLLLGTLRRRLRDACAPGDTGPPGSSWCRRVKVLSAENGASWGRMEAARCDAGVKKGGELSVRDSRTEGIAPCEILLQCRLPDFV
jgi:hypothetical protein